MPVLKPQELVNNRVQAVKAYHAEAHQPKAELDLSGGIDSAVMAGVLVLALGAKNVTLAHLGINSNPEQTDRARRLAKGLGCPLAVIDVTAEYESLVKKIVDSLVEAAPQGPWWGGIGLKSPGERTREEIEARIKADPTILGSIRSTLRAPLGRAFNRLTGGGIRHGTGNECEDRFLRFYQKGGDGEVDSNPVAMLSKAEIYQLAYELATGGYFPNVGTDNNAKQAYIDTIRAVPSADLWGVGDKHNDETEIKSWLGADFTYGKLDPATGKVYKIGTIERVARFLDDRESDIHIDTNEKRLFSDSTTGEWCNLIPIAQRHPAFAGVNSMEVEKLLQGARKAERCTRHKWNPNCPALGSRKDLIDAGILTDNFNAYGV